MHQEQLSKIKWLQIEQNILVPIVYIKICQPFKGLIKSNIAR